MVSAVTVITPSFNSMPFIEDCIKSVIAQGTSIAQHIIMDGGSSDGTVEMIRRYENKYPLIWRSEPDNGQSHAIAKAIDLVATDYFLWLNSDDLLIPGAIKELLSHMSNTEQSPSIVYGDYSKIDELGRLIAYRKQPTFSYWDCLYGYLTIQNAAAIFNTLNVRKAGGIDCRLRFAMDYDLVLKTAPLGIVLHVPVHVGSFRLHAASKTSNLQEVCKSETLALRKKYSNKTTLSLYWRACLAKFRVFSRMMAQGCILCRLSHQPRA